MAKVQETKAKEEWFIMVDSRATWSPSKGVICRGVKPFKLALTDRVKAALKGKIIKKSLAQTEVTK